MYLQVVLAPGYLRVSIELKERGGAQAAKQWWAYGYK